MTPPPWLPSPAPFALALSAPDTPGDKLRAHADFCRAEHARRLLLADDCNRSKALRQELLEIYRDNPVAWCNDWVWVENPAAQSAGFGIDDPARVESPPGKLVPLYLFDRACIPEQMRADPLMASQAEIWKWWRDLLTGPGQNPEGVEVLLKKSREMAMSYSAIAFGVWLAIFHKADIIYCSFKADEVDTLGKPSSLLEKARIIIRNLPGWQNHGWSARDERHNKHMLITIPNGGQLIGASGPEPGRSARSLYAFVDEDAVNPDAEAASQSLSKTARVRIRITTSRGPSTSFAQEWARGIKPRKFLHWRSSPFLDSDYGTRYEASNGMIKRAQELEGNDDGSIVGAVIPPEWIEAAMTWKPTKRGGPKVIGYDIADDGKDSACRVFREGPEVRAIEYDPRETVVEGWPRLKLFLTQHGADCVNFDDGGGFGGTVKSMHDNERPSWRIVGIKGGMSAPDDLYFDDAPNQSAHERFANTRTAYWWVLRERCRKTWERMQGIKDWPEDECVSLPRDMRLREDLLLPRLVNRGSKIALAPKKDMPRSTDVGDAVCYSLWAGPRPPSISVSPTSFAPKRRSPYALR